MKLSVNYRSGMVAIDKRLYPLDDLKQFLITNYPGLVEHFYVRAIHEQGRHTDTSCTRRGAVVSVNRQIHYNGKTVFTYDWKEILRRAEQTVLPIHDYLQFRLLTGGQALP